MSGNKQICAMELLPSLQLSNELIFDLEAKCRTGKSNSSGSIIYCTVGTFSD